MRFRVDELAARAGVSVDTLRFYQSRGLLPPPERQGRVGWYGDEHLERLRRILELKRKGFSLASIKSLIEGGIDVADRALAEALEREDPGGTDERFNLEELAREAGTAPEIVSIAVQEGLLKPGEDGLFGLQDAQAIRSGLALLEAGVPLSELLSLARRHHEAMSAVAERAVDLFAEHVRDPLRREAGTPEEAAERVVAAFRQMLPATTALVTHHFRMVLIETARARLEEAGSDPAVSA